MTVVMAGWAGLTGAYEAWQRDPQTIGKYFPKRFLEHCEKAISEANSTDIPLPEGAVSLEKGCLAALWQLGEQEDCGFSVEGERIPLPQQVVELCEALGLDPLRIPGRGYVALRAEAPREGETVLGYTRADKTRVLCREDRISYLTPEGREG